MDYYQLLGVDRSASYEAIKKAFQLKAFSLHPDHSEQRKTVGGDDVRRQNHEAEKNKQLFQKIVEAYNVLRDPKRRKHYDAMLDRWHGAYRGDGQQEKGTHGDATFMDADADEWIHVRQEDDEMYWSQRQKTDEWIRNMAKGFEGYAADGARLQREREMAWKRLQEEAWMYEKNEAEGHKRRTERLLYKTEMARAARNVNLLKKHWQSQRAITRQDVALGTVLLGTIAWGVVEVAAWVL